MAERLCLNCKSDRQRVGAGVITVIIMPAIFLAIWLAIWLCPRWGLQASNPMRQGSDDSTVPVPSESPPSNSVASPISTIESLDKNLGELGDDRRHLEEEKERLEAELASALEAISMLAAQEEQVRKRMERRLLALHRKGRADSMALWFGAAEGETLTRSKELSAYALRHDRYLLQQVQLAGKALEEAQVEALEGMARVDYLAGMLQDKDASILEQRVERERIVEAVRKDPEAMAAAIIELESAQDQAYGHLGRLVTKGKGGEGESQTLESMKGRLMWPTKGSIKRGFGQVRHPVLGVWLNHAGVDIGAPQGAAVRAVHAGKVVYSGWIRGLGRVVVIDHGAGAHTVSARLDEVLAETDDSLKQGDLIGTVGQTGSVEESHLHFEIRHQGQAQNPIPWLSPNQ